MIIAIHGKAQSGKDTVARAIHYYLIGYDKSNIDIQHYEDYLSLQAPGWETRKFAEGVLNHCADILGIHRYIFKRQWENNIDGFRNKDNQLGCTNRELMIKVGNGSREFINHNIWYNQLIRQYNNLIDNWIITDLRYYNCHMGLMDYNALQIKVTSYRQLNIDSPSETNLDNVKHWDAIFNNDTTIEELYHKVRAWLLKIKLIE